VLSVSLSKRGTAVQMIVLFVAILIAPVEALAIELDGHGTSPAAAAMARLNAEIKRDAAKCERLGTARIGLNPEGVLKSCWGKPQTVNITRTAGHTYEQWVYSFGYLYLTDDLVTAIQTSR
jgi:hypothetical protein